MRVWTHCALAAGCWLLTLLSPMAPGQGQQKTPDEVADRLINAFGGRITRDETRTGHPVVGVDLSSSRIDDARLVGLSLLRDLEVLSLEGVGVAEVGMKEIASLIQLRSLDLRRTAITDQTLAALGRLRKLQTLSLAFTSIGDAGLAHVSTLENLTSLDLSLTRVTDQGLEKLASCRKLSKLTLRFTRVSKEAIARLQKAIPGLQVER